MNPDDIQILQILARGHQLRFIDTHHMPLMAINFIQGHKTTRKPTKTAVFELMPTIVVATGKPTMGS
jgi:hypothetical protein